MEKKYKSPIQPNVDEVSSGWRARFNQLLTTSSRHPRPWYKRWWGSLLIFIGSLACLFLVVFIYKVANYTWQLKTGKITAEELMMENSTGLDPATIITLSKGPAPYYLGTSTPKILIVEYGDFNCSHCRVAYPTIRKIVAQNKDIVQYVWRDWPGQENSEILAQAARCAGEQAGNLGFWLFHDELLLNQGKYSTTTDLVALAKEYGLVADKMKDCLDNKRMLGYLQKDYQDAVTLGGVSGTPTWFINGYRFTGELPKEFFNYMINQLTKTK
ncbi:MAG TPA: thioredoxin domain-containing protein [bacterium]|nr:thioredoxin domain-containing protein [bacterium]